MKVNEIVGYVDLETLKPKPKAEPIADWFCFAVRAMSEEKLGAELGETAYYPKRWAWHRRRVRGGGRKREKKFYPLFPGYLFYNGNPEDGAVKWMFSDRRVFGLVGREGIPHRLRNTDIHRLRLEELNNFDGFEASLTEVFSVNVGERLQIVKGVFSGETALVRRIAFGRALVEMEGTGTFVKFTVSKLGKISE